MTKQEAVKAILELVVQLEGCAAIADRSTGYGAGSSRLGDELDAVGDELRKIAAGLSDK